MNEAYKELFTKKYDCELIVPVDIAGRPSYIMPVHAKNLAEMRKMWVRETYYELQHLRRYRIWQLASLKTLGIKNRIQRRLMNI